MKKERQIGLRVGIPAFFCMELEEYHKHAQGAHKALAFPDFLGFLVGLGLEAYKKQYPQEEAPEEPATPDDWETGPEQAARFRVLSPGRDWDLETGEDRYEGCPPVLRRESPGRCPGSYKPLTRIEP